MYLPGHFGIYGIESLRVIEGIYAHNYAKATGTDPATAFLIKTARKPNQAELDYQQRLEDGERAPHGTYWFNWYQYSVQNVLLKYSLPPSSKQIRDIVESTFGHALENERVYVMSKLVRDGCYNLNNHYFGVNTWQIIEVIAALDALGLDRDYKAIALLFNKIYKRDPLGIEYECCEKVNITTPEEIQNEIESIVDVKIGRAVSAKRGAR